MDPREQLNEARVAASEGRHSDALRAHIWFHENALAHAPSLYGVRLSYALADWIDLGRKYPQALQSLQAVCDANTAALIAGPRRRELFHDVEAINRALGVTARTHDLFRRLSEIDADFARSCSSLAMPAIVEAEDFALAARFLPDPKARIRSLAEQFNESVTSLLDPTRSTRSTDAKLAGHARAFADEVGILVTVLAHTGRAAEATVVRDLAISSVEVDSVRDSVRDLLS